MSPVWKRTSPAQKTASLSCGQRSAASSRSRSASSFRFSQVAFQASSASRSLSGSRSASRTAVSMCCCTPFSEASSDQPGFTVQASRTAVW